MQELHPRILASWWAWVRDVGAAEGRDLVRTVSNMTGGWGRQRWPRWRSRGSQRALQHLRTAPRGRTKPGPGQEEEGGHCGLEESGAEQQEGGARQEEAGGAGGGGEVGQELEGLLGSGPG